MPTILALRNGAFGETQSPPTRLALPAPRLVHPAILMSSGAGSVGGRVAV